MMLPIPGTLSIEHLKENLAALDIELSGRRVRDVGLALAHAAPRLAFSLTHRGE